jgi:hypothetical protein
MPTRKRPVIKGRSFMAEAEQQLFPTIPPERLKPEQREAVTALAKQLYEQHTKVHIP